MIFMGIVRKKETVSLDKTLITLSKIEILRESDYQSVLEPKNPEISLLMPKAMAKNYELGRKIQIITKPIMS